MLAQRLLLLLLALFHSIDSFMLSSIVENKAVVPKRRVGDSVCFEIPAGVVVTIASGLAILLRPESALWELINGEPTPSAEAEALCAALCRADGWEVTATIGSEVARSLGGTGTLARSDVSGTAAIKLLLRFDADQRFTAYPQGTAALLRPSRYVTAVQPAGLWSVEVDEEDGLVPQALELRLETEEIAMSGATLVPAGQLFFNARLESDESASRVAALTSGRPTGNQVIRFADGRIVVKEYGALGAVAGLSELKVVGTFDARPGASVLSNDERGDALSQVS